VCLLGLCVAVCSGACLTDVDNEGLDAVSWAAVGGHLHCLELMLDRGSDIDHADKINRTPLHLASFYGHEQVVCREILSFSFSSRRPWYFATSTCAVVASSVCAVLVSTEITEFT